MQALFLSRTLLALPAAAVLAAASAAQTTWHVDASAPAPGLGTQASPYADLAYALAQPATLAGDTLLVAPGSYAGPIDFLGKDVLVQSTQGASLTFLDGGFAWPPLGLSTPPGAPVVRFTSGEGPGAVLDGFTVQHGDGLADPIVTSRARGSGVYVDGASPTLQNLVVRENVGSHGVGMYFANSAAAVRDCTIEDNVENCYCSDVRGLGLFASSAITVEGVTIRDNQTGGEGGGLWASAGTFTGCTIERNTALHGGGAFLTGAATLVGCTLRENRATSVDADPGAGGGVHGGTAIECLIEGNTLAKAGGGAFGTNLVRCTIRGNRVRRPMTTVSPFGGGGVWGGTLTDCDVHDNEALAAFGVPQGNEGGGVHTSTVSGSRIHHNTAEAYGGPLAFIGRGGAGAAHSTLTDCDVFANTLLPGPSSPVPPDCGGGGLLGGTATFCRIWENTAPLTAGAANATLRSCTVTRNTATVAGGGVGALYAASSTSTVENSIVWNDSQPETVVAGGGTLTLRYCDIQGGAGGPGNFDADPRFQGDVHDDFHLLASSPCVDTGDPQEVDPDGTRIDVGAYPLACEAHSYCVGKPNSLGCVPAAGSTGTPALSGPDDFHVTCSNVRRNALGLLLWSRASDDVPFFNGTLCLGGTLRRTPAQSAGGTGTGPNCTGHFDFHFTQAYLVSRMVQPFETLFAQWYMRDVLHPDGTGVGLSDAVAFTVCP